MAILAFACARSDGCDMLRQGHDSLLSPHSVLTALPNMASGSELAFFEEHEEFNAVVARLVALEDVAASDGEAKGLVAKAASMVSQTITASV